MGGFVLDFRVKATQSTPKALKASPPLLFSGGGGLITDAFGKTFLKKNWGREYCLEGRWALNDANIPWILSATPGELSSAVRCRLQTGAPPRVG